MRILVYGIEKKGYQVPRENPKSRKEAILEPYFSEENVSSIKVGKNELFFEPFNTDVEFNDYDGVIMFQGIWADRKLTNDWYSSREVLVNIENDELRKRVKQLQLLLKKDGFICFLMDRLESDDFDLSKEVLSWYPSTYWDAIRDAASVQVVRDELKSFADKYAVARTKYKTFSDVPYEPLLRISSYDGDVGVCFDKKVFFLPCLAPDKSSNHTRKLFEILSKGLVSVFKKINQELPTWVNEYTFKNESDLLKNEEKLVKELSEINASKVIFEQYKEILVKSSDDLRKSIYFVLSEGLGYEVDEKDNYREDLKILSKEGDVKAVVEIKGINTNVDRKSINQVDDHKERAGFPSTFPGILIVNTFIKSSNTIADKDKPVEQEQIKKAVQNNVLILRTIDLLRALDLVLLDPKNKEQLDLFFFKKSGWLEVKDEKFILHSE